MGDSINVKPRSTSARSFSVSKSPSAGDLNKSPKTKSKTLRSLHSTPNNGTQTEPGTAQGSPTSSTNISASSSLVMELSNPLMSNDPAVHGMSYEDSFLQRISSASSLGNYGMSEDEPPTFKQRPPSHSVSVPRPIRYKPGLSTQHDSSPTSSVATSPRSWTGSPVLPSVSPEFGDSELVAAFEAMMYPSMSSGGSNVFQDLSSEDFYQLMSKETVRISSKMKSTKTKRSAKDAFDSFTPPSTSPRARLHSSAGSSSGAGSSSHAHERATVTFGDLPSEQSFSDIFEDAARNWASLDLAKKERRIKSFMSKYEHIRAQLDVNVKDSIPLPLNFSDYPPNPETPYLIVTKDDNMLIELGDPSTTVEKQMALLHVEQKNIEVNYYTDWFVKSEHRNWVADDKEIGPIVLSIQMPTKDKEGKTTANSRVFVRTKENDEWMFIASKGKSSELLSIFKKERPKFAKVKFEKVKTEKISPLLVQLESTLGFKRTLKIGVLPVLQSQRDENQMFANTKVSKEYEEFLEFLGSKIVLKGWTGFAGGLDTNNNMTGTHSVFSEFNSYSIMFHVSTLLPYTDDDEQQLDRKRHLGNDVVNIVWLDGAGDSFDPSTLTTNFTYVFFVISLDHQTTEKTGEVHYKLAIASKEGTRPFGPRVHSPSCFKKGSSFRKFLFTKLINAERAAIEAPSFKAKMHRTRATLLDDLVKNFK